LPLTGFRLIKDLHPLRQDAALMRCTHGTLVVLAVIPRAVLEQHFWRASLTQEELDKLVASDIGAFGLVVLAKYRRGEIGSWLSRDSQREARRPAHWQCGYAVSPHSLR